MANGTPGKKIEILHPIEHDGKKFSRGLHELEAKLADVFLALKDPISKQPIARLPEKPKEVQKGTVENAGGNKGKD